MAAGRFAAKEVFTACRLTNSLLKKSSIVIARSVIATNQSRRALKVLTTSLLRFATLCEILPNFG
jgi:hypothetical protein